MPRIVALVAVAVVAAACGGGGDPVVATVADVEIHRSDVVALRTTPDDLVELDSGDFRNELMFLIAQETLAAGLAADFGVSVTAEDVVAARERNLASGGLTIEQAVAAMQDPAAATPARFDSFVRSQLLRERAMDALGASAELLDDIFANRLDLVVTVCPRHILVATEIEAGSVVGRLAHGDDFAAVADEVSADTAPGGDLGCGPAARFVEPFALATIEAPLGEAFGPVESEFGWHVLVVDERTTPTRDEVASDPRRHLPEALMQSEFTNWFNDKLDEVSITVLDEVGTWAPEGPGILPPEE